MPESVRDLAVASLRRGDYPQALARFRQALQENPDDWYLLYGVGQSYRFLGEVQKASQYLRRAAELNPEPTVLLALGIALQLAGELEESITILAAAIAADPDLPQAYNSLALSQRKSGAYDKALHNYDAGTQALARRIVKRMKNLRESPIVDDCRVIGEKWIECATFGALYWAAMDSVGSVVWPGGDGTGRKAHQHGGLYYIDSQAADAITRCFLPNYFNTFSEQLRADDSFRMLMGNQATVLDLLGRHVLAEQYSAEAEEFRPY
jgi:tetratricopeptide (TPR) repeat protein